MDELQSVSGRSEHETHDEDDIVWVMVIRGKRSALVLSSIEFAGALISAALIADVGIPPGSQFMFVMQVMTLSFCGIFLIPPFLRKFMNRFKSVGEKSRVLVWFIALLCFFVGVLSFFSAVVASRAFEECRGLDEEGLCSRMQAAISITFLVSFATFGSFLVIFLGSIIPKDITVTTYMRGLGRAATLAAARGASGRVVDHGFESIPLDVVVHTNRSFGGDAASEWNLKQGEMSPRESTVGLMNRVDESVDMTGDDNDDSSLIDDRKSVDVMDII